MRVKKNVESVIPRPDLRGLPVLKMLMQDDAYHCACTGAVLRRGRYGHDDGWGLVHRGRRGHDVLLKNVRLVVVVVWDYVLEQIILCKSLRET